MKTEQWKDIEGFEGLYEISDQGRLRSLHPRNYGRIIRQTKTLDGYRHTTLYKNGIRYPRRIAKLVMESFVGPKPSDIHQINHRNGKKDNNRRSNLEYVTPRENMIHASTNQLMAKGELHWKSKLTEANVVEIRTSKETGIALAKKFGMHKQTISLIKRRKLWTHVP